MALPLFPVFGDGVTVEKTNEAQANLQHSFDQETYTGLLSDILQNQEQEMQIDTPPPKIRLISSPLSSLAGVGSDLYTALDYEVPYKTTPYSSAGATEVESEERVSYSASMADINVLPGYTQFITYKGHDIGISLDTSGAMSFSTDKARITLDKIRMSDMSFWFGVGKTTGIGYPDDDTTKQLIEQILGEGYQVKEFAINSIVGEVNGMVTVNLGNAVINAIPISSVTLATFLDAVINEEHVIETKVSKREGEGAIWHSVKYFLDEIDPKTIDDKKAREKIEKYQSFLSHSREMEIFLKYEGGN